MRRQKLARRADFLAAAQGKRWRLRSFTLQAIAQKGPPGDETPGDGVPRFGFTVTKKLGGAVVRNRIRRRLKEALRLADTLPARPWHDYVIVAQPAALGQRFCALQDELQRAFTDIHGPGGASHGKGKGRSGGKPRAEKPKAGAGARPQ
jgi:ribonuclease P protein component